MGSCTAGGAYVPAMSDETVIVREQGTIFLGGPPLVKAATGEEVTAEELGGGDVHARTSGVVDHLADDDEHALRDRALDRRDAAAAGRRRRGSAPRRGRRRSTPTPATALVPPDTPHALRPARADRAASSTAAACTSSRRSYGTTLVCGFAHIHGHPVGIVANHGILFSESALKARALRRALRPARRPAAVPAEHHRLHGRPRVRGRRDRQGRREDGRRRLHARACRS